MPGWGWSKLGPASAGVGGTVGEEIAGGLVPVARTFPPSWLGAELGWGPDCPEGMKWVMARKAQSPAAASPQLCRQERLL